MRAPGIGANVARTAGAEFGKLGGAVIRNLPRFPLWDDLAGAAIDWFAPSPALDPMGVYHPGHGFSRFEQVCPPMTAYPFEPFYTQTAAVCGAGPATCVLLQAVTPNAVEGGDFTGARQFAMWAERLLGIADRYIMRYRFCAPAPSPAHPKGGGYIGRPWPNEIPAPLPYSFPPNVPYLPTWDPMSVPIGAPQPAPEVLPYPLRPRGPNPQRVPGERREVGPRPAVRPQPRKWPRPPTPPGVFPPFVDPVIQPPPWRPGPVPYFEIGQQWITSPAYKFRPENYSAIQPRVRLKPRRGERQIKVAMKYGALAKMFRWFINATTEKLDILDAAWKSIPKACRPRNLMPSAKAEFVFRNPELMDARELVKNLVKNEVEDRFYALQGAAVVHGYQQAGMQQGGNWFGSNWGTDDDEQRLRRKMAEGYNPLDTVNEFIDDLAGTDPRFAAQQVKGSKCSALLSRSSSAPGGLGKRSRLWRKKQELE